MNIKRWFTTGRDDAYHPTSYEVVKASDYDALIDRFDAQVDRTAALRAELEKYQACRVHDVDEKAWLSERMTRYEKALREIDSDTVDCRGEVCRHIARAALESPDGSAGSGEVNG